MIDKNFIYAVVGANNDQNKYGYKVFEDLLNAGYKVIPINPNEEEILGEKCYKNLSEYNKKIDFVIFVVPPQITEKILEEVRDINIARGELCIRQVWMQPGSESKKAILFCEENNINFVTNSCIMIQRKNKLSNN